MIQRIQSLWLALAVVCIGLCFLFPVAKYQLAADNLSSENRRCESQLDLVAKVQKDAPTDKQQMEAGEPVMVIRQSDTNMTTWPLVTLAIVSGAIGLICIFLFKNRRLQMRLATLGFMTTLAYVFLLFFWAVDMYADEFLGNTRAVPRPMCRGVLAPSSPWRRWCSSSWHSVPSARTKPWCVPLTD